MTIGAAYADRLRYHCHVVRRRGGQAVQVGKRSLSSFTRCESKHCWQTNAGDGASRTAARYPASPPCQLYHIVYGPRRLPNVRWFRWWPALRLYIRGGAARWWPCSPVTVTTRRRCHDDPASLPCRPGGGVTCDHIGEPRCRQLTCWWSLCQSELGPGPAMANWCSPML